MKAKLTFLFFILNFSIYAQTNIFQLGAKSSSLAFASATFSDGWSVFNNVGGLGDIQSNSVNASFRNKYSLIELNTVGLAYSHKLKYFNSAISFYRFGDEIYNENKIAVAIGKKINFVSLGIQTHIIQYFIETIGNKHIFTFDFGGIAEITKDKKLLLGANIFNFNRATITNNEYLPIIMKLGLSYLPDESLTLVSEIEKDIDKSEVLKFGIAYKFNEYVELRTGINPTTKIYSFGMGLEIKKFQLDYSYAFKKALGNIHEISFSYNIGTK